jgi:hypothetical protein
MEITTKLSNLLLNIGLGGIQLRMKILLMLISFGRLGNEISTLITLGKMVKWTLINQSKFTENWTTINS